MASLAIVLVAAAIFITQAVSDYLHDPSGDLEVRLELFPLFGRLPLSLLTLYQMTLASGVWERPGRLLIFEVSPWFAIFFVTFGWLVSFAMVSVVSAIFLKQTLAAAAGDSDTALRERKAKKDADMATLRSLFEEGDKDGSGYIDWAEFKTMVCDHRVRAWLGTLDVTATDMATIFSLLGDGDERISFDEFIDGVVKCKGHARGVEVVKLMSKFEQMNQSIADISEALASHVQKYGLGNPEPSKC